MGKINIQVSRETHRKLQELGRKGQTFDDIIKQLIETYENQNH